MLEITDEKFDETRNLAEELYKNAGRIRCPYLDEDVHFNAEGFEHLLFKSWNKSRTRGEQYTRLRLFPLAPLIISKSHTLQEYDERKLFVRQKINSRWEQRMKTVRYFVFVAIVKNVRLKVVVKEIEGGAKFFYSLYPSWRVVMSENGNQRKVFYSGDLETL